ncbi:hypothetical protein AB0A05_26885 [Streptomyces sp. NPDC046374]|uniref:hypothetical protein n=1 Tax=Streptomyces sp. NPDC046374 TaxID=3154917 RepID=UPI0034012514
MAKARGKIATRARLDRLHALDNAGILTFVRSVPSDGINGPTFVVEVGGKEIELRGGEVETFTDGLVLGSGRAADIDFERPFPAAS